MFLQVIPCYILIQDAEEIYRRALLEMMGNTFVATGNPKQAVEIIVYTDLEAVKCFKESR